MTNLEIIGEFKPINVKGLDWDEQQGVKFTIEVHAEGTDNEPLTALHIFGRYKDEGEEQSVKFEIPLTEKQGKKLIRMLEGKE